MHVHPLYIALLAASVATTAAPAAGNGKLVLLRANESRVEVDATGQVTAVQSDPALPAPVADALAANIRKIAFAPPMKDGKAVAGVTYVWQDACAAPEGGAYRLAVKFRGNGPALVQPMFPSYPVEALQARESSRWTFDFDVAPDGTATLHEARRLDGGSHRFNADFKKAIALWMAAERFRPEQLAGAPVGTRVSSMVEFGIGDRPMKMKDVRLAPAADNASCQLALSAPPAPDQRVALDSPFHPRVVE